VQQEGFYRLASFAPRCQGGHRHTWQDS
jgi:hypothetical protein